MSIEPVPPRSPYQALPARSFWKTGVAEQHPLALKDIYKPKFAITRADRIGTFGSCFAQHLAQFLTNRGYNVLDFERPPPGLDAVESRRFGYGLYSARYGNIYTARQLLQLLREADGSFSPACAVWSRAGRFYDALRPSVEPRGLPTAMAVETHRKAHLERVRELIASIDIMVFTLGLTEAWVHRPSGTVYPTAPGTIAGDFDPDVFAFKNFTYDEMYRDFLAIRELLKRANPAVRFLLTVSPVPLTATASHDHVLVATIYSKSVLRAVAGALCMEFEDVDYFPSYELIASPFAQASFYESNLRSVCKAGVDLVMKTFLQEHGTAATMTERDGDKKPGPANFDPACEELLLEAYAE